MNGTENCKTRKECWARTRAVLWTHDCWRFRTSYPMEYWTGTGYIKYRDEKNYFIVAVGTDVAGLTGIITKPYPCCWHWWHGAELTFSGAVTPIRSTRNLLFSNSLFTRWVIARIYQQRFKFVVSTSFFNIIWLSDLKYVCSCKMYTEMYY